MATNHRTARGIAVDMDRLRLANEQTIAVGNMKVNARGDQLGAGGKVIKTRAQVLAEKNKLHGALADDFEVFDSAQSHAQAHPDLIIPVNNTTKVAGPTDVAVASKVEVDPAGYVKPRGSFAESVAGETEVAQELLDPAEVINTPANQPGIKRI